MTKRCKFSTSFGWFSRYTTWLFVDVWGYGLGDGGNITMPDAESNDIEIHRREDIDGFVVFLFIAYGCFVGIVVAPVAHQVKIKAELLVRVVVRIFKTFQTWGLENTLDGQ